MISQTAHSSCCVKNTEMWKALARGDFTQRLTKTAQNKWHRRTAAPQLMRPKACLSVGAVLAFISWPGAEIASKEEEKHRGWTIEIRTSPAYIFYCVN